MFCACQITTLEGHKANDVRDGQRLLQRGLGVRRVGRGHLGLELDHRALHALARRKGQDRGVQRNPVVGPAMQQVGYRIRVERLGLDRPAQAGVDRETCRQRQRRRRRVYARTP